MMNPNCIVDEIGSKRSSMVVDGSASALLSSCAAEAVEGSQDLLTEILLRVPTKSLSRFKCVSNRWLSLISDLISDPDFRRRHTLRHPIPKASGIFIRNQFFSFSGNYHSALDLDPDLDPNGNNGIQILQSCNGLLLCSTSSPCKYFIYNPTTRHFKVLPRPPIGLATDDNVDVKLNLAFDPSRSTNYTVVCVSRIFDRPGYYCRPRGIIMVYSSQVKRRAWRPCRSFNAPREMSLQRGVYCGGALNWIGSETPASLRPTSLKSIILIRFDLSQKCIRKYDLPLPRGFYHFGLAAACGHLYLVEASFNWHNRVLRLERDYSRWVLMYNIDLTGLGAKFQKMIMSHSYYYYMLLSLVGDDNGGGPSLLMHVAGKVVLLCLKDNTFKEICDLVLDPSDTDGILTLSNWNHAAHDYIDSLANCV